MRSGGLATFARRHALIALAAVAVVSAALLGATAPFDHEFAATRFRVLGREPTHRLTVVEIDARSLAAAPQWPWPRSRFAQAIENLRAAGANLIGFDVDFSAASSGDQDRSLAAAINASPDSIVLPTFVQRGGRYRNHPLGLLSHDALIATVSVDLDSDGRVRSYRLGREQAGPYVQSMGALLANASYGSEASFLLDYGIRADHIDRISFDDVVNNHFDPRVIAGRSVLIGSTALELGDDFATPIAPSMSGVYAHALGFESIVQGRMLLSVSPFVAALMGLAVLLLLWPRTRQGRVPAWARHASVAAATLLTPFILQAITPLSLDVGIVFFAQALAAWRAVQCELDRRAQLLVQQREAGLRAAARHDPETSLPNRRAMVEDLADMMRDNSEAGFIALAIGVEQFTAMRGAIGHAKMNALIRSLAELVEAKCPDARVFHLSTSILGVAAIGDQAVFEVMMHDLHSELETELTVGEHKLGVSLRVGAALAKHKQATAEQLIERAVVALDYARTNKKRVLRYNESFPDPKKFLALLADMTRGIERGEFHIVYQPKARAGDGDVVGAEALMRWDHPVDGPLPPDLFISMAEETGAIDQLTLWTLRRVIEDQRQMRELGLDQTLSVNISGRTLGDAEFRDTAIAIIREHDADICLEITETAVILEPEAAVETVRAFREAGIRVSIDDYGAGLSSLSYLKRIAADELKIDKSLIADLLTTSRDRLIVKSTVDLAHGLGMSVVAEGVESDATRLLLASMGCDCVQGYLIGRPVPLNEFVATLAPAEQASASNMAASA